MKQLKNPFLILAFGLTLLFFVPLPQEFLPIKIVIGLMVIAYGISIGAFRQKDLEKQEKQEDTENLRSRLQEVEKKLAEMEAKENEPRESK